MIRRMWEIVTTGALLLYLLLLLLLAWIFGVELEE